MSLKKAYSVVIADDHLLFADGLEQLVNSMDDFHAIAKATNGKHLLQILNQHQPSLILLDINMPLLNGIATAEEIHKKMPDIKVILVSMYFNPKVIQEALKIPVNGVIPKDATADVFKETLTAVMRGELKYIDAKATAETDLELNDAFSRQFNLSARELEIIQLIKKGITSKEIASALFLSELTIETHRKNIFRKLNVKSSSALLSFVHENGL